MYKIEKLSKSFGKNKILKNLSLEISKGERVVIIGPSGSGKSTFLRCLNGLESFQGKVFFENKYITKNDFNLLPSILNYLVSSEHFCFSFTNNDLERIYNIVNYCRFNMLKENEKKFMLCDIIIGKLNMLTMHNQQREENKENSLLYTKFVKALLELTAVNKENIVKNFKDLSKIQ